jgi:hypothetical protein
MDTKVIPFSELRADLEGLLSRCLDASEALIVELPDRGFISIQPMTESDDGLIDDLIENNPAFREKLAKSLAGPREAFDFENP